MESSGRNFSNEVAEHRPILKNNQNTAPVLVSYAKQYSLPKNGSFIFTVFLHEETI